MKKQIQAVQKFNKAYGHPIGDDLNFVPKVRAELRFDLMREENEEYMEAVEAGDLVEIADALGDMMYILAGTIIEHGMQNKIEEVFEEIQRSNMSKLGEDGKPIYRDDGKILKGPNYSKPNLIPILNR